MIDAGHRDRRRAVGDEGKGKIVDIYTEHADMVVRFGGGPNAGHTLVVGNDKLVVRLVPSGILRADTTCVLAQGMVIDPRSLVTELDELERRGIVTKGRLLVSDRAHVIFPYHVQVDGLREGKKNAIGHHEARRRALLRGQGRAARRTARRLPRSGPPP